MTRSIFMRLTAILLLFTLFLACAAGCADDKEPISFPEAGLAGHSFKSENGTQLGYLLYTPKNPTEQMPLIVYLHEGGGRGNEPTLLLQGDGFPQYLEQGKLGDIPAFVLIPQLAQSQTGWDSVKDAVMALVDKVCNDYAIDTTRVGLTGHGMGGSGTWSLAIAYPNRFSRIAPLSGTVKKTSAKIDALSAMPVRAFIGTADTVMSPDDTCSFAEALRQKNEAATLTSLEGGKHFDLPSLVYLNAEYDLINWLIAAND